MSEHKSAETLRKYLAQQFPATVGNVRLFQLIDAVENESQIAGLEMAAERLREGLQNIPSESTCSACDRFLNGKVEEILALAAKLKEGK